MTVTGPDVSHHNGDVDMDAVAGTGHRMVGIKATEDTGFLDPQFRRNRMHARSAGLIRLLYHFARPSSGNNSLDDARREADWFCSQLGVLEPGEIAVLDIEDPSVAAGVNLGPWALAFLAQVDERTGRAGGSPDDDAELYTYGPYATAHLRLSNDLGDRRLWLAAYTTSPKTPAPWHGWTFWQYTSNGTCPGIVGRCDLNRFTGPYEALQHLAGIDTTATPPNAQEDLLMAAAQDDNDARRALVRIWCEDLWGHGALTDSDLNILAYSFGSGGAELTFAHIADHAKAQAYRASHAA